MHRSPNGLSTWTGSNASHVKLMTDHELFVKEQDRAWERHERFVAEHERFVAEQDRAWERQKERDALINARIDKLVSGIGRFIADNGGKAA